MPIRPTIFAAAIAAAAFSFAAAPALAAQSHDSCFLARDWGNWRSPSPTVIYLRVGPGEVYQLDLSAPSSELQAPDTHLISYVRGSDWICSPVDLQLEVTDSAGAFRQPLFVKSLTWLTPEQVQAIPAKYRP